MTDDGLMGKDSIRAVDDRNAPSTDSWSPILPRTHHSRDDSDETKNPEPTYERRYTSPEGVCVLELHLIRMNPAQSVG